MSVQGVPDADFAAELGARDVEHVQRDADVTVLGVESRDDLAGIEVAWARTVQPGGSLWVVYPKGVRTVTQNEVRDAGLALGIVDNKIARFSDTHTALRFVARRAPAKR